MPREVFDADELALQPEYPHRSMFRGDNLVFDVQIQRPPAGSPPGTPPVPVNLSSVKMYFSAKHHLGDPDNQAVSFLSNGHGIVYTDVLNGKAEITMPALATYQFPNGKVMLFTTVKIIDASGNPFTAEVGTIDVWPSGVVATT